MSLLPRALEELIDTLGMLPGVGARTAERYAYYLLKRDESSRQRLARAITNIAQGVKQCPITYAFMDADEDISPLYADPERHKTIVAVVEEPFDVLAIEQTGFFRGTYHVLGGALSPIDNVGPEMLHIPELLARITRDKVEEVILALNASVEGESTVLYLQQVIKDSGLEVKVTRLARGIPVGVDLEYADKITLSHALEGRRSL